MGRKRKAPPRPRTPRKRSRESNGIGLPVPQAIPEEKEGTPPGSPLPASHSVRRRRQVDINKPIPVVWMDSEDVKEQSETLAKYFQAKNGSTKPLTPQAMIQNHQLLSSQSIETPKELQQPVVIPRVRSVESSSDSDEEPTTITSYSRPVSYLHYSDSAYDFEERRNYEIDDRDDDFLLLWNTTVEEEDSLQIDEDHFEYILTMLENLSFLNRSLGLEKPKKTKKKKGDPFSMDVLWKSILSVEYDNPDVTLDSLEKLKAQLIPLQGLECEVCGPSNYKGKPHSQDIQYLHCSVCSTVCHRDCYYPNHCKGGPPRPKLPSLDETLTTTSVQLKWTCDRCKFTKKKKTTTKCALCSSQTGLLRSVAKSDSKYGKFAHITCALWTEEITFDTRKQGQIKGLSKIRSFRWNMECRYCGERGVCIQCTASHCRHLYHPHCAARANCFLDHTTKLFFCEKHTEEHILSTQGPSKLKYSFSLPVTQLENLMPIVKKKAKELLELKKGPASLLFEVIFYYWKYKRLQTKSFLIQKLNQMLEEEDEISEKPKKGKKRVDELQSLMRIFQMRKDLEKVRILLDMLRKRETMKHVWFQNHKRITELEFLSATRTSLRDSGEYLSEDEEVEEEVEEEEEEEEERGEETKSEEPEEEEKVVEISDSDEVIMVLSSSEEHSPSPPPSPPKTRSSLGKRKSRRREKEVSPEKPIRKTKKRKKKRY